MIRILTLLLIALPILSVQPVQAADPLDPFGGAGDPVGGCSWDQFLEQLGCQETGFVCGGGACPKSCDRQYTVKSPRAHDPSWGKWQFTPDTWRRYTGQQYPQCQGMANSMSVECRPAQKWATERMMEDAVEWFKARDWCGAKLGQTVTGTHQGTTKTCQINKSGLLSAYHNAGTNACNFAGGSSKWSSQINWRICDAADIPFPENCTPSNSDAPNVPDTVTPATPFVAPPGTGFDRPGHFASLDRTLKYIWVSAFQQMTTQITTMMMQQVQIVGTFFDAKHQLETQALIQEKAAQAHKDYQPSTQMCEFGTFVRNLANTEKRSDLTKTALTRAMLDRALATGDSKTSKDGMDQRTKKRALIDKFCNSVDNAKQNALLCDGTYKPEQVNADINFTRSIDAPLTLDINLLDTNIKPDEENIFAFLDYIFMHDRFPWMSQSKTVLFNFIGPYQDMRSIIAMRSVAQNSFAEIIAQKTAGPDNADESVGPFMKALLREIGIADDDIETTIGKNPSYYAQMEMLTKKIYQHPEFISNLYDKPANVKRIRAAMTAIKLMQDRDIHDALLRREMLMSMMLELKLRDQQNDLLNRVIKPVNTNKAGEADPSFSGGAAGGGGAGGTF